MASCPDDELEVWKPIEGFPGYEVSNQGRVRSYHGWNSERRRGILKQPQRVLRPGRTSGGHRYVILRRDQRSHPMRVGRLVAQAFIGPAPAQSVVLHLDGDVDNNRVENLAYGSPGDARGHHVSISRAKVTPAQVLEIRQRRAVGEAARSIAAAFGIASQTVNGIYRGDSWRHVGGPTRAPAERLSDDDVRAIRVAFAAGTPRSGIMARWDVSESHLSLLLRGKRRCKAGGPICD
jgi:hypothetical protein